MAKWRSLVEIAQPTIGVITAVGHSHMEGLGSIVDIANEKRDIFRYFKEDNIGIVNGDQPLLAQVAYNHPVIKFGSKTTNQVQARKIQVGSDSLVFTLKLYGEKHKITLPTNHKAAGISLVGGSSRWISSWYSISYDYSKYARRRGGSGQI